MARNRVQLYYIQKVPVSRIIRENFNIITDYRTERISGNITSIGDNQVLKFIRKIKGQHISKEEIQEMQSLKRKYQRDGASTKKITNLQNKINETLFVPDLITVKADTTKKDYKTVCKQQFTVQILVNKTTYTVKYKRLCAGAGQLRRNSAFFVNEELYDMLENIMMCGLTKAKIGKINLAKFSAYYSLYTSSTNVVQTPNICVVPDYEYILKNQDVDWIYTNGEGQTDIQERIMDFNMNAFDGSGMISPAMAEIWKENLNLDYMPSSFIIRGPWLKGLVSVFDFHRFAKEIAKTDTITDIYGTVYDVDKIDVILTKSQFKLWKKYDSWDSYMYYFRKFGHCIGVTRVNKKESDYATTLNYQYIQSNNFSLDSVKKLAEPTVEYLKKVLECDPVYARLMLWGYHEDDTVEGMYASLDSPIAKCLLYTNEILNDKTVVDKIRKMARKKLDQAKIGKVLVEGAYDFIIPDLYAMAEHAFGMKVHGLLPAKCLWSRRWVEKGVKRVSTQRSPLVAPSENQVMNVYTNEECEKWFKYIRWGNIYSIWDLTIISQSDAD